MEVNAPNVIKLFAYLAAVKLSGSLSSQTDLEYKLKRAELSSGGNQVHKMRNQPAFKLTSWMVGAFFVAIFSTLMYYAVQDELNNSMFYKIGVPPSKASRRMFRNAVNQQENDFRSGLISEDLFLEKAAYIKFLSFETNLFQHYLHGTNPFKEMKYEDLKKLYENNIKLVLEKTAISQQLYFSILSVMKDFFMNLFLMYTISLSRSSMNGVFFIASLAAFVVAGIQVSSQAFQLIDLDSFLPQTELLDAHFLTLSGKLGVISNVFLPLLVIVIIFYLEFTFQDKSEIEKFFMEIAREQQNDSKILLTHLDSVVGKMMKSERKQS